VLADVRSAVDDGAAMYQRMHAARDEVAASTAFERDETAAFLAWVVANNFVFLGSADYQLAAGESVLVRVAESGLGLLRDVAHPRFGRCLSGIPGAVAELGKESPNSAKIRRQ